MNTRKIILSILLMVVFCTSVYPEEAKSTKNVLILYSMMPTTPAYRVISDGIRARLVEEYGDAVNLHSEYLETERYPKGEYPKAEFEPFNRKYEDVSLDLLICVGIDIVDPVKKNASEYILALPNIVIDFDLSEYGLAMDLKLNDRTAVIGLELEIPTTISTALSLFPDRHEVYFICGTSAPDKLYLSATKEASKEFEASNHFNYITDISMDEVLQMVRHLPDSSMIFIPGFNADSKGVHYQNHEALRLVSQAASVPVFAYTDIGFGDGTVGGYLLSFNKIGLLAGGIAVKILNGADPSSFVVSETETYDYLLDWRQLKRWGLDGSSLIPRGSHIMFREENFFERYRLIIIIAILFIIAQALMIVNLVRLYRRQRLMTDKLVESDNKFRELIREDRILRLGQMTASLSHELNQPLTAILSTAQAGIRFLDSGKADYEMLKEIFQNIVEDDKRTAAILSSIRGLMKLEQREKEKTNLEVLVQEVMNIFHGEANEKKINLDVKYADVPVYILADRIQIQQVILNLITNAAHFVEGNEAARRAILVSETVTDGEVTVSVRDYGVGIDEALKNKIFSPFITSRDKGTGIGLAIARSIIEDHQGRIWAENMPEGGARFSFSLRIYKDN